MNTATFVTIFVFVLAISLYATFPFFNGLAQIGCENLLFKQDHGLAYGANDRPLDSGVKDTGNIKPDRISKSQQFIQLADSQHFAEPFFALHIGPPKTGTSTIQGVAADHEKLLQKDNIYYLGHYGKRAETKLHELSKLCRKCDRQDGCSGCPQRWQDFEDIVDEHFKQGHNVFISDETFNRFLSNETEAEEFLWTRLAHIVNKFSHVEIIYTYRRYHDWVPSNYHQSWNPMGNRDQQGRASWPDEGGPDIPTFESNYDQLDSYKRPSYIKKVWEEHFDNVSIFNMHEESDFVKSFFCNQLSQAHHLCDYLETRTLKLTKNPSTSKTLHFDMLAVEARKRGLIPKKSKVYTRPAVTLAIEEHAKSLGLVSLMDFPTKCLDATQEKAFLQASLELEEEMTTPDFFASPRGKAEVLDQFAESVEKGKFCSIDVDLTLKDPKWQQFFREMT